MIVSIKRSAPDISSKDSPSNGSEAACHDGVNLRQCELVEVGLDDERSRGLAQEYVGGRVQRLAGSRTLATLQSLVLVSYRPLVIGDLRDLSIRNKIQRGKSFKDNTNTDNEDCLLLLGEANQSL